MPTSLDHIEPRTPMGAHLVADGATFRVWAPDARSVHVSGEFNNWVHDESNRLVRDDRGHWRGFVRGVKDGDRYRFYVVGRGSAGFKRDPYARELTTPFPGDCLVRSPEFPWHDAGFRPPRFHEWILYQLHVGTFDASAWPPHAGTFLDVALRLPHFVALGINALQLLPIVEFQTAFSKGYNGTDYFSPEMDFGVGDDRLPSYLDRLNLLLAARGLAPWTAADLRGPMNQLKALVDLCHVHGIAVIFDVVYNHAGGDFGDESLYFFDRRPGQYRERPELNNSLYFIDRGHAGGLVFAIWRAEVRQFLIDNAVFLLGEYHVDGLRYDQVSVLTTEAAGPAWPFWQDLTSTVRFLAPSSVHKAEFWPVNVDVVRPVSEGGAGFSTALTDGLRIAIRAVIGGASVPGGGPLDMTGLASALWQPGFPATWQFVEGPENHDLVYRDRDPRLPRLADPSNPRSWYARSRARVATALALTAPGVPMLFMGQEFLEDKPWADDLDHHADLRIHWAGLEGGDRHMADHFRCVRDLVALRRRLPGLTGDGLSILRVHDRDRVLAFQRWVPGEGHDVVVVVNLSDGNRHDYPIPLPRPGAWREVFNSDVYDHFPNPMAVGNGGTVLAGPSTEGPWFVARMVLPANSVLVLAL